MSVARVIEISSTSPTSFEHAIQSGIARANETLRQVKSAWVKDQRVEVDGEQITTYQVNLLLTFVLEHETEDAERPLASEPW
jgi:flavin-binding protein dodecin